MLEILLRVYKWYLKREFYYRECNKENVLLHEIITWKRNKSNDIHAVLYIIGERKVSSIRSTYMYVRIVSIK